MNYFEKHALCSSSLSLSHLLTTVLLYPIARYLSRTRAPYQLPRLASLRLATVSSFSANWYYGSALSSETEMQVGFTRVFTRDAHLHSRCSRSPVSATRVMRCRAYTRACAYTYTGIDTDAVMHREGGGRKRRISTETREKGDGERGRGQIDERIEGGKEGSEGCKGI